MFLKDKPHSTNFALEHAKRECRTNWERIGAAGDFDSAIAEFTIRQNASSPTLGDRDRCGSAVGQAIEKLFRVVKTVHKFVRNA